MEKKMAIPATSSAQYSLLASEKSLSTDSRLRIPQAIMILEALARKLVSGTITNYLDLGKEFPEFKRRISDCTDIFSGTSKKLDMAFSAQLDKSCKEIFDQDAPGEISQPSRDLLKRMQTIYDCFPCWAEYTAPPKDIWKNFDFRVQQIADDLIDYTKRNSIIREDELWQFLNKKIITEPYCPQGFQTLLRQRVYLHMQYISGSSPKLNQVFKIMTALSYLAPIR
jgi:hypothetical protein